MNKTHLRHFLIHLLVWVGFAGYEQLTLVLTHAPGYDVTRVCVTYLLNIGLFYLTSEGIFPVFYRRRRYWLCAAGVLAALALYGLLRCELYFRWLPAAPPGYSYWQYWVLVEYRGTFFLFASIGYSFAAHTIQLRRQEYEQEQQLRKAEKSLMEANLAFLRNQINPHFLFNSLNFLYAQVYPHSTDAARGVLLLSDMMRYALQENTLDKVPLAQEVAHVQNYLQLNQLRFHQQLQVDFRLEGSVQFLLMAPLVLITFVENCFKHGELTDAAHPLLISLAVRQNTLTFETRNRKRLGPREVSHGIGLANIRQRLDLLYPERYTLTIQDEPQQYTCRLIIAL